MKKIWITYLLLLVCSAITAQNKMLIHTANEVTELEIAATDSMYFSQDGSMVLFSVSGIVSEYPVIEVDSITFNMANDSSLYITFLEDVVEVINPFAETDVAVAISEAGVTVFNNASIVGVNVVLSGTSTNGFFKLYADQPTNLLLNGLNLTNPVGPAINIQANETVDIHLVTGTSNVLADGITYDPPAINGNGEEEDQKAAFFSESTLVFAGQGSLTINGHGSDQHGLASDDAIEIQQGTIVINSAAKDGIHAKDGFAMYGGTINITSSGDGLDGDEGSVFIASGQLTVFNTENDVKAIKADGTITISGGSHNITVSGNQSKGLKSDEEIVLNGGTLHVLASGDAVLEASGSGYDPSYCTAIKCSANVVVDGSTLVLTTTGKASRGISSDGDLMLLSGSVEVVSSGNGATYTNSSGENDAYHGVCLKSDQNIIVEACTLILSNSGSGGKGISSDGALTIGGDDFVPVIQVTTTGSPITISAGWGGQEGEYDESKTITVDGAISIISGDLTISSADDGIKSKESITVTGGEIKINRAIEGMEAPEIIINDGEVNVYSSDDAMNATFGNGGETYDGSLLEINGGYLMVSASGGDALDSNGDIVINGGTIVGHGPQSSPEVGMDMNGTCKITGGFMVLSGTNSNHTEGASSNSTQTSLLLKTNTGLPANTLFHIEDVNGNNVVTFAPSRQYYSIIFTSEALTVGSTYKVYTGGSSTGTVKDGLYEGGTYSGGTLKTTFTINATTSQVWF